MKKMDWMECGSALESRATTLNLLAPCSEHQRVIVGMAGSRGRVRAQLTNRISTAMLHHCCGPAPREKARPGQTELPTFTKCFVYIHTYGYSPTVL